MILAAGYLLYMYGRVAFGEVSDFLRGLGDHLTDMTPVEILTLVPLGALVVIFGIQPGLLLDLVRATVDATIDRRGRGRHGRSPSRPRCVVGPSLLLVGRHRGPDRLGADTETRPGPPYGAAREGGAAH